MVEKIRRLAKENGTTQTKLEGELGFSQGAIGKWDYHSPTIDKVAMVADKLGVTIDDLVKEEEEKPTEISELSKRTEEVILLLRDIPWEYRDLAHDLVEGTLESLIRHLPVPAEVQSAFRGASSH